MKNLLIALCVSIAVRSGAQVQQAQPPVASPATIISPIALAAFRAGTRAAALPLPVAGASPLASVVVSWAPYPGAAGYEILRYARQGSAMYPPVVVGQPGTVGGAGYVKPATTLVDTVGQIPPGWTVAFRVVAVVGGRGVDTTNAAAATAAAFTPGDWTHALDGATLQMGLGGVQLDYCTSDAPAAITVAWFPNPAAAHYTLQLLSQASGAAISAVGQPSTYSPPTPLPPKTVFGHIATVSPPTGQWDIYVRPEFLVYNWPSTGPNAVIDVPGRWVYAGVGSVPPLLGRAHAPCGHR